VEQQRDIGIGRQLAPLAAVEVGVEHESIGAVAFQQHHADRRVSIGRGRGQRHRIGVVGLAGLRLGEPRFEDREGIGVGDGVGILFRLHWNFLKGVYGVYTVQRKFSGGVF
jgi:hypothetical protein